MYAVRVASLKTLVRQICALVKLRIPLSCSHHFPGFPSTPNNESIAPCRCLNHSKNVTSDQNTQFITRLNHTQQDCCRIIHNLPGGIFLLHRPAGSGKINVLAHLTLGNMTYLKLTKLTNLESESVTASYSPTPSAESSTSSSVPITPKSGKRLVIPSTTSGKQVKTSTKSKRFFMPDPKKKKDGDPEVARTYSMWDGNSRLYASMFFITFIHVPSFITREMILNKLLVTFSVRSQAM
ncbi:hypothetical protein P9112_010008 [Eukaryota sp. TZLM1-RC]